MKLHILEHSILMNDILNNITHIESKCNYVVNNLLNKILSIVDK